MSNIYDNNPATEYASVTPSDTTNLSKICRGIYIGGGDGTMSILTPDDQTQAFDGLQVGVVYPFRIKRVNSTGTGATSIVALN